MGGRFMKCLGTPSIALLRHWRQLVHPLLPLSPLNLLLIHHLSSHERCLAPNGAPGGAVRGSRGAPAEASFLLRVQLRCRLDACQAALAPRTRVAATTAAIGAGAVLHRLLGLQSDDVGLLLHAGPQQRPVFSPE